MVSLLSYERVESHIEYTMLTSINEDESVSAAATVVSVVVLLVLMPCRCRLYRGV